MTDSKANAAQNSVLSEGQVAHEINSQGSVAHVNEPVTPMRGARPHVTPVSAVNLEYAEKYIQSLNSRNRNLNIGRAAWMVTAIALGAVAGKNYLDLQAVQYQQQQQLANVQFLESEKQRWQSGAEAAQAELRQLKQGFNELTSGAPVTGDDNMIQSLRDRINEYETRTAQLQTERDNLFGQYKALKKTLDDIEAQFATVSTTKEDTVALLEQKQKQIDELSTKLQFSSDQVTGLKKQLEEGKEGFEALARRYQDSKKELLSTSAELDKARSELTLQKKLVKDSEQKLQSANAELTQLTQQYAELKESLRLMVQPIGPGK